MKPTNQNKHKPNKIYNKSPHRINHKATKSKTNSGTTALEPQTAALPRPQEEEETDKSKQAQTEQTYEKH